MDPRHRTILECAARLFRHYGPSKTTIADIAREARVGVGTVYLVFPSKEAIVSELSSGAHESVMQAMREIAEVNADRDLATRFRGVLEARTAGFQRLSTEGQHACELFHCKADAVRTVHEHFRERERLLFATLLRDAEARGELAALDHTRTALVMQRALTTLTPPWLFEQPAEEAARLTSEMASLLLLGLCARPSE